MNFESITRRLRRQYLALSAKPARRSATRTQPLKVETLENREVPAVLAGPDIDYTTTRFVTVPGVNITGFTVNGAIAPTIVADPNNPNQLFGAVEYTQDNGNSRVGIMYSGNGGQSWSTPVDGAGRSIPIQNGNDVNAAGLNTFIPYTNVSNPSVAYDKFGFVYLTYVEHNVGSTSGRLVLRKYRFAGTPVEQNINDQSATGRGSSTISQGGGSTGNEKTIYQWINTDGAFNPTVAIDTNFDTFTDNELDAIAAKPSVADRTQTDPFAATQTSTDTTKVFVAWNTFDIVPANNGGDFVRSKIRMTVSQDGGKNFGPQVLVNNQDNTAAITGGNYQNNGEEYTAPKIVFTQGRAGLANSGGKMVTMFSGTVLNNLYADSYDFSTNTANDLPGQNVSLELPESVEFWRYSPANINEATLASPAHLYNFTLYPIIVPTDTDITRLDKLAVTLALSNDDLSNIRIDLVAPGPGPVITYPGLPAAGTGSINTAQRRSLTLVQNRVDGAGNNLNRGIGGTQLGRLKPDGNGNAYSFGTTFEDNAARRISDGTAVDGFAGHFKPEVGSLDAAFGGMSNSLVIPSTLPRDDLSFNGGEWTIVITDFRSSGTNPPNRIISRAGIKLSQDFNDDLKSSQTFPGAETSTGAGVTPNFYSGTGHPTASPANPAGLGTSLTMAVDNSLGLFSPYQNRVYAAYYSGGTKVIYSDNAGLLWSSNASDVSGPVNPNTILGPVAGDANTALFNPMITVDPTTGTVLVSGYSNAQDSTGRRSVTMLSTSVNGAAFEPDPLRIPQGTLEFSPAYAVNPIDQTYDQIETAIKDIEHVSSNGPALATVSGNETYGNNTGLVAYGGEVKLLYTGNLDRNIAQIRTQQLKIASGPRIVGSDAGVVLGAARIDDLHDNTIDVDLNQVVDSSTFTFNAIQQLFDPNGRLFSMTQATTITPIDGIGGNVIVGDSRFFRISLPMSVFEGRYQLRLRPNVITTPGGTPIVFPFPPFINADVVTRAISYNVPTANGQVFDAFYVEFDRVIDVSTFTPEDINLRYRAPNEDSTVGGRRITGLTIEPLDIQRDPLLGTYYGAKRFLVRLTTPEAAPPTDFIDVDLGRDIDKRLKELNPLYVEGTGSANTSSFTVSDILGVTGPNGAVSTAGVTLEPITDRGGSVLAPGTNSRYFRVRFPSTLSAGDYKVTLNPAAGTITATTVATGTVNIPFAGPLAVSVGQAGTYSYTIGRFNTNPAAPYEANKYGSTDASPDDGSIADRIRAYKIPTQQNRSISRNARAQGTAPVTITDQLGTVATTIISPIQMPNVAPPLGATATVVGKVTVTIDVTHTRLADLEFRLQAPNGQIITLFNAADLSGANLISTKLDDIAPTPITSVLATAPYTGTFQAVGLLSTFRSSIVGGAIGVVPPWNLIMTDRAGGDEGALDNWTLDIELLDIYARTLGDGNLMDQNGNSLQNEDVQDVYAVPAPQPNANDLIRPFVAPFVPQSLPVVVPGPRVVNTQTFLQNPDYIDVDLGQVVNSTTFTAADILSITGDSGALTLSLASVTSVEPITGVNGSPATGNSRFFRIHYATRLTPGDYQVTLGNPAGVSINDPVGTPVTFDSALLGLAPEPTQTPDADFIDIDLGQVVDSRTFNATDLVQITGPNGNIDVANPSNPIFVRPITDIGGVRALQDSRYFRIYFNQVLVPSGRYEVTLGNNIFLPRRPLSGNRVQPPYEPLTAAVFPDPVIGHTTSPENVVYNSSATQIDVKFDRIMNTSTFTRGNPADLVNDPDDILRIIGPTGDIPLTGVTINPIDEFGGSIITGNSQYYRISFPAQQLPGNYQIQIGSNIADLAGNLMDKDTNAGVGVLSGSPAVFPLPPGAVVIPQSYASVVSPAVPAVIPALSTVNIPLNINGLTDGYQIQKITANVSANVAVGRTMRDLEVRLVSPDGTISVLLFRNAPRTGTTSAISDVTFDDAANAPVQNGFAGAGGRNNPIQPLAQLNGILASGIWNLEVTNLGPSVANISKFALTMDKYVIGDGLGDAIADQTSLGLRVFFSDELTGTGNKNWNPVGIDGNTSGGDTFNPISGARINSGSNPIDPITGLALDPSQPTNVSQEPSDPSRTTVGRISNVAVDPSDPSGNTVYASGASGGVWRTTNFLTRDVRGPNWVPLTDFGANQVYRNAFGQVIRYGSSINVGSLTVINETGDPLQSKIIVGTGSDALNIIDQEDQTGLNTSTARYDGVGFLYSEDAGRTWNILDSQRNYGTPTGAPVGSPEQYLDVTDVQRNHLFVGSVINKVVVEKKLVPNANPLILYAAVGRGSTPAADNVAGLWRSFDAGRTWSQIFRDATGNDVTDFAIGEGSAQFNSFSRPTIGYVAVKGSGVFKTTNLNAGSGVLFTAMNGGLGRPTIRQNAVSGSVPVNASQLPNGANTGKIVLATPLYQPNNPLANNYYQGWVVAAVSTASGLLDGVYVTKDSGANWTRLNLNNTGGYSDGGTDIEGSSGDGVYFSGRSVNGVFQNAANHSLTLALDPLDPNILYVGGDKIIRVDMTMVNDPYKLQLYSHTDNSGNIYTSTTDANTSGANGGGLVRNDDTRGTPLLNSATPINNAYDTDLAAVRRRKWNFLNLKFNPYEPFLQDTTIFTTNLNSFTNDGADITWTETQIDRLPTETDPAVGSIVERRGDFDWVSNIVTFVDPLSGRARVIYGHDEGIGTFVSNDDGTLNRQDGFYQPDLLLGNRTNLLNDLTNTNRVNLPVNGSRNAVGTYRPDLPLTDTTDLQVNGNRNGNIQVARLYSGDIQPSTLAAGISNSLLLGAARRTDDAYASENDLYASGTRSWDNVSRDGRANYITTDQTGSGTVYILRRINDIENAGDPTTDFFQIQQNGGIPTSRTFGLFQNTTSDPQGFGQWTNEVKRFAVNPIDGNGISMSSRVGRLFSTVDMGLNWFVSAEPADLDGTYAGSVAYGAPVIPRAGDPPATLNDYIYAGTDGGSVFVKTGNFLAPVWTDISNGLDGSPVLKLIANPTRGSNSAYCVTDRGVYFMADWTSTDPFASSWQDVTGNLFSITGNAFQNQGLNGLNGNETYETTLLQKLTTIAVDWRPLTFANPGTPILYAGGDHGVYRSLNNGSTWIRFTESGTNAVNEGGGLPNVKITDLDLSIGNVIQATGRNDTDLSVLPNKLVATTLGRGTWTIELITPNDSPTLAALPDLTILEDEPLPTVVPLTGIAAGNGELTQSMTITATSSDQNVIPDGNITVNYTSPDTFGDLTFFAEPGTFTTTTPVTITVTVMDNGGTLGGGSDTFSVSFNVTVLPVNDQPTIDDLLPPTGTITVDEDSAAVDVPLSGIFDGDGGGQTLIVTAISSNQAIVPNPVITYTSDNPAGTLTFKPVANQFTTGTPVTVTVRVRDSGGNDPSIGDVNFIDKTFTIAVNSVNDEPTFVKGPDIYVPSDSGPYSQAAAWATNVRSGPPNESGQGLAFTLDVNGSESLFATLPVIDLAGKLTFEPATGAVGTVQVTVTLTDTGGTAFGGDDSSTQEFFILIGVNRAPVLTDPGNLELLPVGEGTATSAGTTVAEIVGNNITDLDVANGRGIAVTAANDLPDAGRWEYSVNNGGTWLDLESASLSSAILLRSQDRIRFIPTTPDFRGQRTITFQAWDQTTGVAGGTADLSIMGATGGSSAFSTGSATAVARVVTILSTIDEDATTTGSTLKRVTDNFVTDLDTGAKKGLAIIGTGGEIAGTWQYSINNGTSWVNFGDVTLGTARLLRDTDKVRFLPGANLSGEVYLKYVAWDQSTGVAGTQADLSGVGALGGNTAFSSASDFLAVRVVPVNDRPVLDTAAATFLTPIDPSVIDNNLTNPGDTVASILGSAVTDYDAGTVPGIAITAVSTKGGGWQYKAPLDPDWTDIFGVTATQVLLLDPTDRIRFVPDGFTVGTATISYKAWDRTDGSAHSIFVGASSGLSTGVEVAQLKVETSPVIVTNAAPVLGIVPDVVLPVTPEDSKTHAGSTVTNLLGSAVTDADNPPLLPGIALTGQTGTANGVWQYLLAGTTTWKPVGNLSDESALLLKDTDKVRFLPNLNYNGDATISYRAWDRSRGTAGQLANLTLPNIYDMFGVGTPNLGGGTTPFSTATETATVTVAPINDVPVLNITSKPALPSVDPGTDPLTIAGATVLSLLGTAVTDPDTGALQGIAVTKALRTNGTWQYQLDGSGVWQDMPVVSAANALFLQPLDLVRFQPSATFIGVETLGYRAWDQTPGTNSLVAGAGQVASTTVHKAALSTATETASVTVNLVNDRPILDITPNVQLPNLAVDDTNSAGVDSATLLGTAVTDADVNPLSGIAVTFVDNSHGTWEFFNGTIWQSLGGVTVTNAILLNATDKVRFVPATGFRGTTTIKYKAWDQTAGTAGTAINTNVTTAFSTAIETATLSVNTAPVLVP